MKQAKHLTLATLAALGIGAAGPALSGYGHSPSAASVESMSSDSTRFSMQSLEAAGRGSFAIPYTASADSGYSYDVYTVTVSDDSYFALPAQYVVVNEPALYFTGGHWYSYTDGTWYSLNDSGEWIALSDAASDADYYAVYTFEPELVAFTTSAEPIELVQYVQPEYSMTVYSPDGSVLHVMGDDQSTVDSVLAAVLDGSMSTS